MAPSSAAQTLWWWPAACPAWRICQLFPELCSQQCRNNGSIPTFPDPENPSGFQSLLVSPPEALAAPHQPQWVLMSGHLQERASGPSSVETRVLTTGASLQTSLAMTVESKARCHLAWISPFSVLLCRHAKRGGGEGLGLINTGHLKAILRSYASRFSGPFSKKECPVAMSVGGTISKVIVVQHRRLSLNLKFAFPLSLVFLLIFYKMKI